MMTTKHASSPRWYQPWRRTEARAAADPADLGTCFGLELSLAPEPAPAQPEDKTSRPVSRAGWTGWMQRLAAKRRAAA